MLMRRLTLSFLIKMKMREKIYFVMQSPKRKISLADLDGDNNNLIDFIKENSVDYNDGKYEDVNKVVEG